MKDYYEILGLSENATIDEIKSRYKYLVFVFHPDRFSDQKFKHKAEEDLKEINSAFEVLSNPDKRAKYDSFRSSNGSSNAIYDSSVHTTTVTKTPSNPITRQFVIDRLEDEITQIDLMKKAGQVLYIAKVDFTGLDLRGLDLSNIFGEEETRKFAVAFVFTNANLQNAILDGNWFRSAIFIQVNLKNAKIRNANISRGNFDHASFVGADFSDTRVFVPNLSGFDFSNCKMIRTFLGPELDLSDSIFRGVNLSGGSLVKSKLGHADFGDTICIETNFNGCEGVGVNFQGSTLRNARFLGAELHRTDFSGVDLQNAYLRSCNLSGSDLSYCDLSGVDILNTNFGGCNLKGAKLSGAKYASDAHIDDQTILPDGSRKGFFNKLTKFI